MSVSSFLQQKLDESEAFVERLQVTFERGLILDGCDNALQRSVTLEFCEGVFGFLSEQLVYGLLLQLTQCLHHGVVPEVVDIVFLAALNFIEEMLRQLVLVVDNFSQTLQGGLSRTNHFEGFVEVPRTVDTLRVPASHDLLRYGNDRPQRWQFLPKQSLVLLGDVRILGDRIEQESCVVE